MTRTGFIDGPPTFTAWVAAQGVQLTPAQLIAAAVLVDLVEPGALPYPETRLLFGDVTAIPAEARDVGVIVAGGRSGKSYLFGALYSTWRAIFADLTSLAPGEQATASVTCPDLRLARHCLQYVRGLSVPQRDVDGGIAIPDLLT